MKPKLHLRAPLVLMLGATIGSIAGANAVELTALREDFESMTDGPLNGQNGWTAPGTTLQMVVDSTNNLGTRVLDGLDTPSRPPYQFTYATKPLALGDRFSRLTAQFDAYAVQDSGGLPSHSSGFHLNASAFPANPGFSYYGPGWLYNRSERAWQFDARFGATNSNFEHIPGGFDQKVSFGIVVDRTSMTTWGTWDFGGGDTGETAHFPLTLEQIDAIDLARISQDYRFSASRGVEVDNIRVDYTPLCGELLWEDFESMNDGPIGGQNGWTAFPSTLQVVADSTNHLGSRVADGPDTPSPRPPYEFASVTKPFDAPSGFGAIIARFDAFAVQDTGTPSHDSGFWLASSSHPAPAHFDYYGPAWWYNRAERAWYFEARYGGLYPSHSQLVPGGFDKKVTLGIIVDRTRREAWGTWDYGEGEVGETAHFPLTLDEIDSLDHVQILQDYRFSASTGVEIDNIRVRCTPPIPSPEIEAQVSGDELVLSWQSLPGFGYQPQMPLPGLTGWTDIPGSYRAGTGEMQSYRYELGATPPEDMFLRLMVEPLSGDFDEGLALYLPFDGDTQDRSPNGTHATNTGATVTENPSGEADSAYYFDDDGSEIFVPDGPTLDVEQLTLAFWFKLDSAAGARELVNKFGSTGNISFGSEWNQNTSVDGTLYFRVTTTVSGMDLAASTIVQIGEWYHFVGTYDGSEMRLYLNGSLDASAPMTGPIFNSSENLRIGRYGFFPGWRMHGSIDEVAIWGRALSEAEVAALYGRGGRL